MDRLRYKFLVLLALAQVYRGTGERTCTDTETKADLACEGQPLSLECPAETPYIVVEYAEYGRQEPEYKICPRPQDWDNDKSNSDLSCSHDALNKISDICDDKSSCLFNASSSLFHDPCPKTYKYLQILYKCSCTRRYARNKETTTPCFMPYSRRTNIQQITTSAPVTMVTATPSLKEMVNKTHIPVPGTLIPTLIRMSSTTYCSTPSSSVIVDYSRNGAEPRRKMTMTFRRTLFFLLLDLFIIYDETLQKDPTLAILWCFLGMLVGLTVLTIATLIILKQRKSKKKEMFRLSQVEPDEENLGSPTIRVSDPSALETSDTQLKLENGSIRNRHREDYDVLPTREPTYPASTNTVVFTNPLWTALRGNGDGTDKSSNANLHSTNSSESGSSENSENSVLRSPDETTRIINNNNQDDNANQSPETKNKITRTFCFPPSDTATIAVGIPSRPISMDSILLHGGSRVRWDFDCSLASPRNKVYSQVSPRRRSDGGESAAVGNLFSKFGVGDVHKSGYNTLPTRFALSDTALTSTPIPHNKRKRADKADKPGRPSDQSKTRTRPPRNRSLDSNRSQNPVTTSNTLNNKSRPPTKKEQPKVNKKNAVNNNNTDTKEPPDFPNVPNRYPLQDEKRLQPVGNYENLPNSPITKANSATSDAIVQTTGPESVPGGNKGAKRVSSGYYSNTTSPSCEYPHSSGNSSKLINSNRGTKETNMDTKEPPGGDDLPPLPPPAEPLSPPSPSRLYNSSLRALQLKTQGEGKERDRSKLAARKVHFS